MAEEQTDGKYEPRGTGLHGEQRDLRGTSFEILLFFFSFFFLSNHLSIFYIFHKAFIRNIAFTAQLNPILWENLSDDNSATRLLHLFQFGRSYEIVLYKNRTTAWYVWDLWQLYS